MNDKNINIFFVLVIGWIAIYIILSMSSISEKIKMLELIYSNSATDFNTEPQMRYAELLEQK